MQYFVAKPNLKFIIKCGYKIVIQDFKIINNYLCLLKKIIHVYQQNLKELKILILNGKTLINIFKNIVVALLL